MIVTLGRVIVVVVVSLLSFGFVSLVVVEIVARFVTLVGALLLTVVLIAIVPLALGCQRAQVPCERLPAAAGGRGRGADKGQAVGRVSTTCTLAALDGPLFR